MTIFGTLFMFFLNLLTKHITNLILYLQGDPEVTSSTFQNEIQSRHAITQIEINMIFKVLIKKFKLKNQQQLCLSLKANIFSFSHWPFHFNLPHGFSLLVCHSFS